ncbi:MAG TPA: hypothetical protein VM681_02505, partial [Candidatus Thermoplasmatota archaeon]|nr:hypothetical protein [Candidatus Thermoplasmatota archaeon]
QWTFSVNEKHQAVRLPGSLTPTPLSDPPPPRGISVAPPLTPEPTSWWILITLAIAGSVLLMFWAHRRRATAGPEERIPEFLVRLEREMAGATQPASETGPPFDSHAEPRERE